MSTTTLADRWWAPQRPTIEPDAVVLAMLEPGDLGSAVLALHRAGAAAIDTVVRGAVPSHDGLIRAMAGARTAVADRVVDSVSKSAEPSYAGLLVMDLFDDAEQGASELYQRAVNAGVSPPIAAGRVSDVFGVPSRMMGRYSILAADPKTNPTVLRDMADRALLEYVSKVVATESDGSTQVSKAERQPQRRRPFREADVVRDQIGRFAEEGHTAAPKFGSMEWLREQLNIGTGAPQEIAGAPVQERPQRTQRTQRQQRTQRTQMRLTPTRAPAERVTAQRKTSDRASAQRRGAERQEIARKLNERSLANAERAMVKELALHRADYAEDILAHDPRYADEHFYELDSEMTVVATGLEGMRMRVRMADQGAGFRDPGTRAFRIGALRDVAGTPEEVGTYSSDSSRQGVAEFVLEHTPDYIEPEVTYVKAADLSMSQESELNYVERRRQEATNLKTSEPWANSHDEDLWVDALPVLQAGDEGEDYQAGSWAIVHWLPSDPNDPGARPRPTVDEFVIHGNPRGRVEGTTKRPSFELDPNQVGRIIAPPGSRPGALARPEQFWDAENHVVVNRWHVQIISEDELDQLRGNVAKAERFARRPFREQDVVRDLLGRFAEEPDDEPVRQRAQRAQRVQRQVRTQRTVERAAPARAGASRVTPVRRGAERAVVERTTLHRKLDEALRRNTARRMAQGELMPELSRSAEHIVLSARQWSRVVENFDPADLSALHDGAPLRLTLLERQYLGAEHTHRAIDVPFVMALKLNENSSMEEGDSKVLAHMDLAQAHDEDVLAEKIESILVDHPEVQRLELIQRGKTIAFAGNIDPLGDQSLIEVDPDIDWTMPVFMNYAGEARARDLTVRDGSELTTLVRPTGLASGDAPFGSVPNPNVHVYRVSNTKWRS